MVRRFIKILIKKNDLSTPCFLLNDVYPLRYIQMILIIFSKASNIKCFRNIIFISLFDFIIFMIHPPKTVLLYME